MPDASGVIRGITVPSVPWLEEYEPGDRVRLVAPVGLEGRTGIVVDPPKSQTGWTDGFVFVDVDGWDNNPVGAPPGYLRRLP